MPIPNRPLESNLAASAPPSPNAIVSALGKNTPVLESPVGLIDGSAEVPAATVVIPLFTIAFVLTSPLKLVAVTTPTALIPPARTCMPVRAVTIPIESTLVTSS